MSKNTKKTEKTEKTEVDTKDETNSLDVYINKNPLFFEFPDRLYVIRFADSLNQDTSKEVTKKPKDEDDLFGDEFSNNTDNFNPTFLFDYSEKKLTKAEFDKMLQEIVTINFDEFEAVDKFNIDAKNLPITEFRMKNLVLFQNTSVIMLCNIINYVFKCKIDQMYLNGVFNDYYDYFVVGNKPLYFKRSFDFVPDYSGNVSTFISWYVKTYKHVESIMGRVDKFDHFITNLSMILYPNEKMSTDIIKIFNKSTTLNNWWSKKIILHDSYVDLSRGTAKTQYIKQGRHSTEYNKHIMAKTDTVSFVFKIKLVNSEINFNSIDISKNGIFVLNFTINVMMSVHEIMSHLHDFINTEAKVYFGENGGDRPIMDYLMTRTLFKNFTSNSKVRQVSYEDDFTIGIGNVSTIYSFSYNKSKKIDVNSVRTLFQFEEIKSRFNSKTSTCLNFYSFINALNYYKFDQHNRKLTPSIVYNMLLPELKFDDADNAINIFANKFSSIAELEFALHFSFPIYSLEAHLKDIPEDPVEATLMRLRNISIKQNLKILMNNDPILFGPRKVPGGDTKAYSALVQQKNQRPSIISKEDYQEIAKKYPMSVVDIKNLSNTKQRVYLVCPYEESRCINFHAFEEQPCIVRCTTKNSNIHQLEECAKSLGAFDGGRFKVDKNQFKSHSIIKYTPSLTPDRKCLMPGKFETLYPMLCCIRVSDVTKNIASLNDYLSYNFHGVALTIKPNLTEDEYEILTELDITGNTKYYLVIQPSDNENSKYIVVEQKTGYPFCVNDNEELFTFIKERYRSNITHRQTIDFINKYIWDGANDRIEEFASLNEYIKEILKNDFKVVIHPRNNYMVGLLKANKTFYIIPPIYWYYSNASNSIHSQFVLDKLINKQIFYEDLDVLIKKAPDCPLVVDVGNNIVGVKISEEIIMPCNPVKNTEFYNSKVEFRSDSVIDILAHMVTLLIAKNPSEIVFQNDRSDGYKCLELIQMYLQKFLKIHKYEQDGKQLMDSFIEFCEEINDGFLKEGSNEFVIVQQSSGVLDMYKCRLVKDTFIEFITNNPYIDFNSRKSMLDAVCELLIKNTDLECLPIEIIIEKEFI